MCTYLYGEFYLYDRSFPLITKHMESYSNSHYYSKWIQTAVYHYKDDYLVSEHALSTGLQYYTCSNINRLSMLIHCNPHIILDAIYTTLNDEEISLSLHLHYLFLQGIMRIGLKGIYMYIHSACVYRAVLRVDYDDDFIVTIMTMHLTKLQKCCN